MSALRGRPAHRRGGGAAPTGVGCDRPGPRLPGLVVAALLAVTGCRGVPAGAEDPAAPDEPSPPEETGGAVAARAGSDADDAASRTPGPQEVTFTEHVAPIVFEECSVCHRPGGPGPFSFLDYEDVRRRARQIAVVTGSGFMPPWLPEPGYGDFAGERRLTREQVDLIRQWVDAGAPEGPPEALPPVPRFADGWQLGEPDLVLEMARPYTVPEEGIDVFRNFVIPAPVPSTRYVRTVDLQVGNPRVVHHAVLMIDDTDSSRLQDAEDPGPGFDGMDAFSHADTPDGHMLGWTPGKVPWEGEEGMAWRLDPGTDVVLQLHMIPSGKPEPVRARVGLYFAEEAPDRRPYSLRLGSRTIDLPPGDDDYEIRDDYVLPVDVDLLSVYPHAHYLGDVMEAWATLPDGGRRWLLRIDGWDFNWQDEYRYRAPVHLPEGSRISMRFTYDNTSDNVRNPHHPPEPVVWGPRSSDEMGDLWLRVLPRESADLAVLDRDFRRKELQAELAGYRFQVRLHPDDAEAHNRLGSTLQVMGRMTEAATHYRRALELDPDLTTAHYNLATVEQYRGNLDAAIDHYRRAVVGRPDFAEAHSNLGAALAARGQLESAVGQYRRALEAEPRYPEAHNNLGVALIRLGRPEEALEHLRQALELRPDYARAHNHTGIALARLGRLDEAIEHFRRAVRLDPEYDDARDNLETALGMKGGKPGDADEADHALT